MLRYTLAAILSSLSSLAIAQGVSLADVKARNGVQLSAEDLQKLMPSAKVVSYTNAGSTRRWENNPNGTFVASSDSKGSSSGRSRPSSGNGTWRIDDKGTYCATIQWPATPEEWCRYIFKVGDKYYGFGRLDDSAQGSEYEFAK